VHLVRDALPEAGRRPRLTLVVGIGNEWRRDDAAGLVVARRLRAAAPSGVRVVEREGEPTDLLDTLAGADEAVVVDAVSSGAPPGTIHRLDTADAPLPSSLFGGSTHALGLAEAVELGRALDRLPGRLIVYGVEGRNFSAGQGLGPEVARAAEALAAELLSRYGP
jgi:hydrogenase maturation protease